MIFFCHVGLQCIGKTRFYQFQRHYLASVVQERYCRENSSILNQLKEQGLYCLSGDGRCGSSRHNTKYLTYSFMDQIINKIVAVTIAKSKVPKKLWLNLTSDALKVLQSIVLDKHVLGYLKYLPKFVKVCIA